MNNLTEELKKDIIEHLNLEDLQPEDIGDDDQLFGGGIGLDSIDALELIVLLEKNYGIKIDNPEEGRKVFHSVGSMARYIAQHRK